MILANCGCQCNFVQNVSPLKKMAVAPLKRRGNKILTSQEDVDIF